MPTKKSFPDRKVIVGNQAKVVKDVSDEMIGWKTAGTKLYQQLPQDCRDTLKPCEPLTEIPKDRVMQNADYKIWKDA